MADEHSASVIEPSQRLCETSSSLGKGPELRKSDSWSGEVWSWEVYNCW